MILPEMGPRENYPQVGDSRKGIVNNHFSVRIAIHNSCFPQSWGILLEALRGSRDVMIITARVY